jgi:drug/metabolite transporter (DMT)-like permease
VGLAIAFAAVLFAFSEGFMGHSSTPRQLRGDALALVGGMLWGLTTLVIRGFEDGDGQRGEDLVLPGGRDRRRGAAAVAGAGRNLVASLIRATPGFSLGCRP